MGQKIREHDMSVLGDSVNQNQSPFLAKAV